MWAALERYQPYADEDEHGESWRVMTTERTAEAAWAAWRAVYDKDAWAAAGAFSAWKIIIEEKNRATYAIKCINKAMEVQP
jgi:hypothetical protein